MEAVGRSIQHLGRKAFPSITGKDFDHLLKGRFYQALLVKWQCKLGPPKADESFHDLFARARMIEEYEKQYQASAEARNPTQTHRSTESARRVPTADRNGASHKEHDRSKPKSGVDSAQRDRQCYLCKEVGHLRRDCPKKTEAPGRSKTSNTGIVATSQRLEDLSEAQLEELLAQKQLQCESSLLPSVDSKTNIISASTRQAEAVGPLAEVLVDIAGVPTIAMVDTGAQSTIISRTTLHDVIRHLKKSGRKVPPLELPTVRLFGKDGQKGGKQLRVTAQLSLDFTLESKSVTVPVFVQPDSDQDCLLGMNAIPLLGIKVLHHDGEPIVSPDPETDQENADLANTSRPECATSTVSLVTSVALPSQKGCIVRARVSSPNTSTHELLFEPNRESLDALGVVALESLVCLEGDEFQLPVENPHGFTIHLDTSTELGTVRHVDLPDKPSEYASHELIGDGVSTAASIKATLPPQDRLERLMEVLSLPLKKLSPEEAKQLTDLISEFSDVFALDDTRLGCMQMVQHSINTGNHAPIRQQPYRTPVVRRQKLEEMVESMQNQGVVVPSSSPWASPVVLVPKKDGSLRFCIDYRRLNAITRKDVYPLPRVYDILVALGEAKFFTSLDLASGYWQIGLDEDAKEKSAFVTYNGLFEFVRMPFGLCNAPATFQRLMQRVLSGLEYKCCFVYLDDVLVASKTFSDHLAHLREVFTRLRSASLRLKPKKCDLLQDKVFFLGHIVSASGIEPDPAKVDKIQSYPTPTDVTSVRSFLGLASYYRRLVPNFAKISAPIHQLMRKDVRFQWTNDCEQAF